MQFVVQIKLVAHPDIRAQGQVMSYFLSYDGRFNVKSIILNLLFHNHKETSDMYARHNSSVLFEHGFKKIGCI